MANEASRSFGVSGGMAKANLKYLNGSKSLFAYAAKIERRHVANGVEAAEIEEASAGMAYHSPKAS